MKKIVVFLTVVCLLSCLTLAWGMGETAKRDAEKTAAEKAQVDAHLAKIETRIRTQKLLPEEELKQFMAAIRTEHEYRENISLKALTLSERNRLMLNEGPIADAVMVMSKNKIAVKEQAKIALAASVATAKGAEPQMVREMVQTMTRDQTTVRVCRDVLDEAGEEAVRDREMTQSRLMTQEMLKLNLKGESLALSIRNMNQLMAGGETPRQARLKVSEEIRLMLKAGDNEKKIAEKLNLRIREHTRLMEAAGNQKMKPEVGRESFPGGGMGGRGKGK